MNVCPQLLLTGNARRQELNLSGNLIGGGGFGVNAYNAGIKSVYALPDVEKEKIQRRLEKMEIKRQVTLDLFAHAQAHARAVTPKSMLLHKTHAHSHMQTHAHSNMQTHTHSHTHT